MSTPPSIPVTVWLKPETRRAFATRGAVTGTDVGTVLARLADLAVEEKIKSAPKRRWTRVTAEHIATAREMAREGRSQKQIAHELGISQAAVHNHWQRIIAGTSR